MSGLVDVVLGLQYGDEGKGKITNQLAASGEYDYVFRYNGGGNAGHTIYKNGNKYVTHLVPCGVLHGINSIIGPGCVLNIRKFQEEIYYLSQAGFDVSKVGIAYNCHIVTEDHVDEDSKDVSIGTTKTGNGPAYRDKINRTGKQAQDIPELNDFLVDLGELSAYDYKFLAEGAQGYFLDIDYGDYPYVTSSNCGIGSVINNGFSHKQINKVYGVAKAYSTYVGAKPYQFEDNSEVEKIRQVGQEYGATTGRPRQIDWLDLDEVIIACQRNGVDNLIINKLDVLEEVGTWKIIQPFEHDRIVLSFDNKNNFINYIDDILTKAFPDMKIQYQDSPM